MVFTKAQSRFASIVLDGFLVLLQLAVLGGVGGLGDLSRCGFSGGVGAGHRRLALGPELTLWILEVFCPQQWRRLDS